MRITFKFIFVLFFCSNILLGQSVFPVFERGKWLLMSKDNQKINNMIYDNLVETSFEGIFIAQKDMKYTIIQQDGSEISPQFMEFKFIQNQVVLCRNERGYFFFFLNEKKSSPNYSMHVDCGIGFHTIYEGNQGITITSDSKILENNIFIKVQKLNELGKNTDLLAFIQADCFAYYTMEGKVGIINKTGAVIFPAIYDKLIEMVNAYQVKIGNKTGLISKNLKTTIPVLYDDITSDQNYFYVMRNGQTGVYDDQFNRLFEPKFNTVAKFDSLHFIVSSENLYGLTDLRGNIKIPVEYTTISAIGEQAYKGTRYDSESLYDQNFRMVYKTQSNRILPFNNNFFLETSKLNHRGIVHISGRKILDSKFHRIKPIEEYPLFLISTFNFETDFIKAATENASNTDQEKYKIRKYGVYNQFREILLDTIYLREQISFELENNIIKAQTDSGVVIVELDNNGKLLDKNIFANVAQVKIKKKVKKMNYWKEDPAKESDLWGLVQNYPYKRLLDYQFYKVYPYYMQDSSFTLVENKKKSKLYENFTFNKVYGLVDNDAGKIILPAKYVSIERTDFNSGDWARCISKEGDFVIINKSFQILGKYAFCDYLNGNYARINVDGKVSSNNSEAYKDFPPVISPDERKLPTEIGRELYVRGGDWGIIDKTGKQVVALKFNFIDKIVNDNVIAQKIQKWGVFKINKDTLIPFQYDLIRYMKFLSGNTYLADSHCYAARLEKWGVVDSLNKILVSFRYDDVRGFSKMNSYLFEVESQKKRGICNSQSKEIVPVKYTSIKEHRMQDKTVLEAISDKNLDGVMDKNGKVILESEYENLYALGNRLYLTGSTNKSIINLQGDTIITDLQQAFRLANNRIRILRNNYYGFIDTLGKVIINPEFTQIKDFHYDRAVFIQKEVKKLFGLIKKTNQYGCIDFDGRKVIGPNFDQISDFVNGKAIARKKNKYSLINKDGKTICTLNFEEVVSFLSPNLLWIRKNSNFQIYNISEKRMQSDLEFSEMGNFHDGIACLRVGGKNFYMDTTGRKLTEPDVIQGSAFSGGFALINKRSNEWAIEQAGKILTIDTSYWKKDFIIALQEILNKYPNAFENKPVTINHCAYWKIEDKVYKIKLNALYYEEYTLENSLLEWGIIKKCNNYQCTLLDLKGNPFSLCKLNNISNFENDLLIFSYKQKIHLYDVSGQRLSKHSFGELKVLPNGSLALYTPNNVIYIDKNGEVFEPK